MMMLKIGQLCYLHSESFRKGGGGVETQNIFFGSPKQIPIGKQARFLL